MKIAVSSTGKDYKARLSDFFARCPYFFIAEIENKKINKFEVIENEVVDQNSGAGIAAAQLIAENNVNAVIVKNIGPRALDVLNQFNIGIYSGDGTVEEALQDFIKGRLKKYSS